MKNQTAREKVDNLLHEDAKMYQNLGTDSTDEERLSVRKRSEEIYKEISKIDPERGRFLIDSHDKDN